MCDEASHFPEACVFDCHETDHMFEVEATMPPLYAAQVAQDSQCGYSCDYQNKRAPVSTNEVTEMMKGLGDLGARLRDEGEQSTKYVFGRFKKRLLSDCYGRGVTRSSVEAVSLLTQSRAWNVCAAESITTS